MTSNRSFDWSDDFDNIPTEQTSRHVPWGKNAYTADKPRLIVISKGESLNFVPIDNIPHGLVEVEDDWETPKEGSRFNDASLTRPIVFDNEGEYYFTSPYGDDKDSMKLVVDVQNRFPKHDAIEDWYDQPQAKKARIDGDVKKANEDAKNKVTDWLNQPQIQQAVEQVKNEVQNRVPGAVGLVGDVVQNVAKAVPEVAAQVGALAGAIAVPIGAVTASKGGANPLSSLWERFNLFGKDFRIGPLGPIVKKNEDGTVAQSRDHDLSVDFASLSSKEKGVYPVLNLTEGTVVEFDLRRAGGLQEVNKDLSPKKNGTTGTGLKIVRFHTPGTYYFIDPKNKDRRLIVHVRSYDDTLDDLQ